MKTPTRQAPHICRQVVLQISASCCALMRKSSATMIHETSIAVPPTPGLKSNAAEIVVPSITEDFAVTAACSQTIAGKLDQGPVHATTTTIRVSTGTQAQKISRFVR